MQQMIDQCVQLMGGMMMGGGMMGGMLLAGPLLLLVVVGAGLSLLRAARTRDGGATTPVVILQERLARGEIGLEEYEQRRSLLHAGERD